MVRRSEKVENPRPSDPETEEKKRLISLALSKKLLRRTPAKPSSPLEPSKPVLKLEGRDIVKRGQRKSRYLFSFPGLLAPISGGRVGELANLSTKNPILYLEFPQGRMKLFGTHVYPKNKYLTLQLTKSSKGVMCEDSFESLIVFSEAWWIGPKEENPEEHQLEFPKGFNESKHAEHDFKGGAGATFEDASGAKKPTKECRVPLSPDTEIEDDMHEDSFTLTAKNENNVLEASPSRQSTRMSGKKLNYAESSSGDDSIASDAEALEMMEEQVNVKSDNATRRSFFGKTEDSSQTTSSSPAPEIEIVDTKKIEQFSSLKKSKENPPNKKGQLAQATLSTLFQKAAEKKSMHSSNHSSESKGSGRKRQRGGSKHILDPVHVKGSDMKEARSGRKKSGTITVSVRKQSQVPDDEPEEISSESQMLRCRSNGVYPLRVIFSSCV